MKTTTIGFFPDTHIPFEDARAFALVLKVFGILEVDIVVILGDFWDCFCISDHDKDPNRVRTLDKERDAVLRRLDQIDRLPSVKDKRYIEGNHEQRLERYLMRRAPELFNLVSIPELLGLKDRGYKFTKYREHDRIGKLFMTHDTGKSGFGAHAQSLNDFGTNVVIGHTHRMDVTYQSTLKGKSHVGASFGWLGDVTKADYMTRVKALRDWRLGFGFGEMEDNGTVHLHCVPIIDYRCLVNGNLIRG